MRRLTTGDSGKEFWETIDCKRLAKIIDDLPSTEDLYYYAKLVSEGAMRYNISDEQQYKYSRFTEGSLRYLFSTHNHESIAGYTNYYIPFFYMVVRVFPTVRAMTFGYLFKQFIRYASTQAEPKNEDDVCEVITTFLDKITR